MNEFQFCYWLMGIFELGEPTSFNEKQILLITEHLKLVEIREYNFCNWLDGFLTSNDSNYLNSNKLSIILTNLQKEFFDFIDHSYPIEIIEDLNKAHKNV